MHFIRRAALRAASAPSTSVISKQRSITTSSPFALRSKVQSSIAQSSFRRFASDEAGTEGKQSVESADGEQGTLRSAVNSATESASTYYNETSNSVKESVGETASAVADAATGAAAAAGIAFQPREDRRQSRPREDRDSRYGGGRDGGRPAYNSRGGDRDGGERRPYQDRRTPVVRDMAPANGIYVGNLLFDVTAADLQREFEPFGKVAKATVASDARGMSKGFGYIEFETTEQATAAIAAKNQTVLEGRRLIVNYMARTTRERPTNPPSKTLFIGNLAFEMSDADLNKLFRDIRNVIDVRVAIDRRTGQPRGFAHADFVDVDSAVKGKEALVGKEVYGRQLRVDFSGGSSREARGDGGAPSSSF